MADFIHFPSSLGPHRDNSEHPAFLSQMSPVEARYLHRDSLYIPLHTISIP